MFLMVRVFTYIEIQKKNSLMFFVIFYILL